MATTTSAMNNTSSVHAVPACMAFILAFGLAAGAVAQNVTLRIVTYNIQADTGGYTTARPGLVIPSGGGTAQQGGVLEGIGEEILGNGPAQPIDILALQETTSNTTTVAPIVTALNTYYNAPGMYAYSPYQATESGNFPSSGNGPNALIYNTTTVQLVASVPVDPPGGTSQLGSASGMYREVMRYEFAPAGVTPTPAIEFYIYVSHYKASTGTQNEAYRAQEAAIIRNDEASHLPADARVLYVGDYNVSTSTEASYQAILAASAPNGIAQGRGIDAMNLSGASGIDWTANSLLGVKTESASSLHYRDDFQVMTTNLYYGAPGGLAYVPGTYHVFGNNGTSPYRGSINSGSNTSLTNVPAGAPISAAQLYLDLTTASDHLPIVAQYTLASLVVPPPIAEFTGDPTNGAGPLSVTFSDVSTGDITNRLWTFGDGATTNTTGTNVTHIYAAGTYGVTLVARGPGGSSTNGQPDYITVLTPFQSWQVAYFGSTTNSAAEPDADPDNDGMSNWAEFLAGTDPRDGASVFRIAAITPQGNDLLITWTMGAGRTNVLQQASSLTDPGGFTDLATVLTAGSVTNYLDPGAATNGDPRYYRVRLGP